MNIRAGDGQGEPDPGHFERFCRVVVPDLLADVATSAPNWPRRIGDDILVRAESYAVLDDTAGTYW